MDLSQLIERLVLDNWNQYALEVAEAYDIAPLYEEESVRHWKILISAVEKQFDQIAKTDARHSGAQRYEIEYVDYQPYKNSKEVINDLIKNKRLLVATEGNDHPVWTPEQNLKFRAVHDIFGHKHGSTSFAFKGEVRAYNQHLKTLPPESYPAMFTEVIGQAAYFNTRRKYPVQKITVLNEFDFVNIGLKKNSI